MSVWDFLIVFGVGFVVGGAMSLFVCFYEYIKKREEAEREEEPPTEPFDE